MNVKTVIIDVGAGLHKRYSDWVNEYKRLEIHAIEPHPQLAEALRMKDYPRVYVHEFAAVSQDGPTTFYLCSDRGSSSTLPFVQRSIRRWKYPIGRRPFKQVGKIEVVGKTLATFIKEQDIGGVSLLNIDVQGNSDDVLAGLGNEKNWNRMKEINVKVHKISYDLYKGQSRNYEVLDTCRRHYFTLRHRKSLNREQEDILGFRSDIAILRGHPFTSSCDWSRKAVL